MSKNVIPTTQKRPSSSRPKPQSDIVLARARLANALIRDAAQAKERRMRSRLALIQRQHDAQLRHLSRWADDGGRS